MAISKNSKDLAKSSMPIMAEEGMELKPVSEMDYSELRDYIKEKYLPNILVAQRTFNFWNTGFSYDFDDKDAQKEILEYYKGESDYTESELAEKTNYRVNDWEIVRVDTDEETGEEYEEELEELSADNTYNGGYLGLVDLNWKAYHDEVYDKYFYIIHPHLGGDIRGNYGEAFILEGDNKDDLFYRFYEGFVSGGLTVFIKMKDALPVKDKNVASTLVFDSEQDSDVAYFNFEEGNSEIKSKIAQDLVDDFNSFKRWEGDEFLEKIVDEYDRTKKSKKYSGGGYLDESPKIYVEILGTDTGKWMDLDGMTEGFEVMDAIQEFIDEYNEAKGGNAEEYRIADMEGFGHDYFYNQYMSESDFDQLLNSYSAYEDSDYPAELIFEYASDNSLDIEDAIRSMEDNYYGAYDEMSDFAYQMVSEGIYIPSGRDVYVTDTDKRLISGEEADAITGDMDNEQIIDESSDGRRTYNSKKQEIESKIEELQDEISSLEDLQSESENDEDYDNIADTITDKESEIEELEEALENLEEEIADDVRQEVYDEIYDRTYDRLENDLEDWLSEYGYEDYTQVNFLVVDYDSIADDLAGDYMVYEVDGKYYFFMNYKGGGKVKSVGKPKDYDYYIIEKEYKKILSGHNSKKEALAEKSKLKKEHNYLSMDVYPRNVVELDMDIDTTSFNSFAKPETFKYGGKVKLRSGLKPSQDDELWKSSNNLKELISESKKDKLSANETKNLKKHLSRVRANNYLKHKTFNVGGMPTTDMLPPDKTPEERKIAHDQRLLTTSRSIDNVKESLGGAKNWIQKQWEEADFGDGKGKAKFFELGGYVKGDEVLFRYDGKTRKGTITDELGNGEYAIFSGSGLGMSQSLVKEENIEGYAPSYERRKFLGIFNDGGQLRRYDAVVYITDINDAKNNEVYLHIHANNEEQAKEIAKERFFSEDAINYDSAYVTKVSVKDRGIIENKNLDVLKALKSKNPEERKGAIKSMKGFDGGGSIEGLKKGEKITLLGDEYIFIKFEQDNSKGYEEERILLKSSDGDIKSYPKDMVEAYSKYKGFDGGGLIAPNGKPSNLTPEQYKLVRTPEFKAWFGDWENNPEGASKVIDENGEPLVVYHGTNEEFWKFNKSKGKGNIKQKSINFSSDKKVAENYGTRIIQCFLNLKKPLIKDYKGENYHTIVFYARFERRIDDIPDYIVNNAQSEKIYDGVIFLNIQDSKSAYDKLTVPIANNYYAFNNNQIKLADGTNKTFDSKNPDIRFDGGGSIENQNKAMLENDAVQIEHHSEELNKVVPKTKKVPAWVIGKTSRINSDLSDVTHYLDGSSQVKKKFDTGGTLELSRDKAQKVFHLPYESAIYVPSTSNVDEVISPDEMDSRVQEVQNYLGNLFGGFSSAETMGGYVDSTGKLVNEDIIKVTSFAEKDAFNQNKDELLNKLADWSKKWGQEAMGFEFEGDLYYVPANYKKGGQLKPIPEGNKGLPKLPKEVRNRMGYMDDGGWVSDFWYLDDKKFPDGGGVEIQVNDVISVMDGDNRITRKVHSIKDDGMIIIQMGKDNFKEVNPNDVIEVKAGKESAIDIITKKIGVPKEVGESILDKSKKFGVWLADISMKKSIDLIKEKQPESEWEGKSEKEIKEMAVKRWMPNVSIFNEYFESKITGILDWLNSPMTGDVAIKEMSFDEAYRKSEEWHNQLESSGETLNYVEPESNRIIKQYEPDENGITFYWALIPNSCEIEKKRMGHCGTTRKGDNLISLRYKMPTVGNNFLSDSRVTIGWSSNDGIFYQIKGTSNAPAKDFNIYNNQYKLAPFIYDLIITMIELEDSEEERVQKLIDEQTEIREKRYIQEKEQAKKSVAKAEATIKSLEEKIDDPDFDFDQLERIEFQIATIKNNEKANYKKLSKIDEEYQRDINEIKQRLSKNKLKFEGFGQEYQDDWKIHSLSVEQKAKILELKPNLTFREQGDAVKLYEEGAMPLEALKKRIEEGDEEFDKYSVKKKLYEAGILDEEPETTVRIEDDIETLSNYLSSDYSDETLYQMITGEDTYEWFDGSWSYYFDEATTYISYLTKENQQGIIDYMVENSDLTQEQIKENGIEYYLNDDEYADEDFVDNIKRSIARALTSAEEGAMLDYYYKKLKEALEELGEVEKLNYEGLILNVDIANLMDEDTIDYYDQRGYSMEEMFHEALGSDIDRPSYYIDDRYTDSDDINKHWMGVEEF